MQSFIGRFLEFSWTSTFIKYKIVDSRELFRVTIFMLIITNKRDKLQETYQWWNNRWVIVRIRNCTSSDHTFWYTCVKWGYLQAFFLFFKILIFWVFRGLKGQKITYFTRQNDYMSRMFFPFFQNFDFSGVRRVKGQKTVQSDKKLWLLRSISQEPCILYMSFKVHMCKMIISLDVSFIFKKFWFCELLLG